MINQYNNLKFRAFSSNNVSEKFKSLKLPPVLESTTIEETFWNSAKEKKIRTYLKGRFLGKGGFAKCYELTCKDNNRIFAAKMLPKKNITSERQREKLITEIKIHKLCHHQNVVSFEHNFEDNDNVYILLELCQNQTLNELQLRRKTLTEIEVQCYIIQLVKALQYLHSHRIIHRDLKLGNLFLNDKMELKVGDFGLATKLDYDEEKKKTICGTPNYIAPEVINNTGHSYEVDVWAIGIIIYTLLIGKPPFETKTVQITYTKIKKAEYEFPEDCQISKVAKNLIQKILVIEPKNRPTLNEILSDDFFNQGIAIPKLMPTSTLAFTPSKNYISKYMPDLSDSKKNKNNNDIKENETNYTNENHNSDENNDSIPFFIDGVILSKKDVWVVKWVDYSNKYGLGYILNNGHIGVHFNDSTKILLNPRTKRYTYIGRKVFNGQELLYTFSVNEVVDELKIKILIFKQFQNFFKDDDKTELTDSFDKSKEKKKTKKNSDASKKKEKIQEKMEKEVENDEYIDCNPEEIDYIFVKKWFKTNHAMIFRLSNKIIQVIFKDNTQIYIHILNNKIVYTDKKGEKFICPLNKVFDQNYDGFNKRIKYIREILSHTTSNNNKKIKKKDSKKTND